MVVTAPAARRPARPDGWRSAGRRQLADDDVAAQATDVAPTILYALGVPISRRWPAGRWSICSSRRSSRATRCATSRRMDARSAGARERSGQPLDQEMIERLRSLGYVR